jgi:hypothetical protein
MLFWLFIIIAGVIGLIWLANVADYKTDVAVTSPAENPNLTSEIERAKTKQLKIARSWIWLFTAGATFGLWLMFYSELKLDFYISWLLGFVVAFFLSRILALYVGMYLGKKYARELKSRFGGGVARTPMPKFIIPQGGRFVEVIAPDEASARAMADKFDVAVVTPIENPNLTVCPDCHHMVSKDAETCPSCGRKLKTTSAERPAELRDSGAMTSGWWYVSNNQRKGPIDDEELRRLLIDGTLNSNSLVWKEGMEGWQPARQIDELSSFLTALPLGLPLPARQTEQIIPLAGWASQHLRAFNLPRLLNSRSGATPSRALGRARRPFSPDWPSSVEA